MTTLNLGTNTVKRLSLHAFLEPYSGKTHAELTKMQSDAVATMHQKLNDTDVSAIVRMIKEILTPAFKANEGLLKEATYAAILNGIIHGKDDELRSVFRKSLPDVEQKIASVGRIVGTAFLQKKKGGARRHTRKAVRRTRKVRSRK